MTQRKLGKCYNLCPIDKTGITNVEPMQCRLTRETKTRDQIFLKKYLSKNVDHIDKLVNMLKGSRNVLQNLADGGKSQLLLGKLPANKCLAR